MSRPIVVALHGVGSTARDMAAALAPLADHATVIALDGGEPFDGAAHGRQWFSIAGVTDASRAVRVADAMPSLLTRFDAVADPHGVDRDHLVLLGFSQGAIMTLALAAQGLHRGRAIAVAGRLAAAVLARPRGRASLLIVHDADDQVMPPRLADAAATALGSAGHRVARVHTAGLGHRIGDATTAAAAAWLGTTVAVDDVPVEVSA